MEVFLYIIGIIIGITLGLLGAGGAIVAVPAFVYIGHIPPTLASGYALFTVAIATALASTRAWKQLLIDWRSFWGFGASTMITIFSIRTFALPAIPNHISFASMRIERDWLLMVAFALVLLLAGIGMLRSPTERQDSGPPHLARLSILGICVGIIAGLLGVGGGFLMTPALVLWARLDMRRAVGTSLALICVNSAVGVAADMASAVTYDWPFVIIFTVLTSVGILVGMFLSSRINAIHLRLIFAWIVILLGMIVLVKELTYL